MTWKKDEMAMDQLLSELKLWSLVVGLTSKYTILPRKSHFFLSFETEVWELENGNNKGINVTLTDFYYGIGLYAIDFNFCSK